MLYWIQLCSPYVSIYLWVSVQLHNPIHAQFAFDHNELDKKLKASGVWQALTAVNCKSSGIAATSIVT